MLPVIHLRNQRSMRVCPPTGLAAPDAAGGPPGCLRDSGKEPFRRRWTSPPVTVSPAMRKVSGLAVKLFEDLFNHWEANGMARGKPSERSLCWSAQACAAGGCW